MPSPRGRRTAPRWSCCSRGPRRLKAWDGWAPRNELAAQPVLSIGVLARSLRTFRGGVDDYVEAFVRHGAPLARDRGHRFTVYVDDHDVAERFHDVPCEAAVVPMGLLGRLGWDHFSSVRRAGADAIDVLICPRSFRPLHVSGASVTVVYDMMYFDIRDALRPSDHGA